MGGIVGNRAIESAAIQWIIKLEGAAGRAALDTRGGGGVADITSPPRTIEVKAFGGVARGQDLWLETTQVNAALADTDFWVYVVENIAQGDSGRISVGDDRRPTARGIAPASARTALLRGAMASG